MGFPERLKMLRENTDVTQDELAKYLQVSRSTIAGYETKNRQPDYEKLFMIARFFNVSTDYLISGKQSISVESFETDNSIDDRLVQYQLRTLYAHLSDKSKLDLLEYARLLSLRDKGK
ncbi:MAG: helix-turn-helix domain-containing protein [Sellimonas sp.]|uniref:helix-turn-helix domain-containing protein n=1 Tax=Sellimonas sp. TaxID=2021466 RepID=UPI00399F043C